MDTFRQRFCEARRNYIRAQHPRLNPRQLEAVMATEGPLLILAGAGSGKTTVLIERIADLLRYGCGADCEELPAGANEESLRLLESAAPEAASLAAIDPVSPWRILAITFTNKAADELKARLERILGDAAQDIWACTFHSACVRILRRDAERLGYTDSFTIYDTADSQALMKRVIRDLSLDEKSFPVRSLLSEISRAKDAQIGPADYLQRAKGSGDYRRIRVGEAYQEYARRMFTANAMDFDDLIANTVQLLRTNDDIRNYWQRRFQYVLVDEYQDTDRLQYQLAALLSGGWGNICVVGDDDQSIYKFRGATIENILGFEQQFPNCRTIRLEQNYRSTSHILDAANAVIRNNLGRKGKELWTDAGSGERIELYFADDERDESSFVASTIMSGLSHGANWRDHAVLYRMNAQSSQLEFAFKRNGIPYRIIGGTRFFDRAEVKDMLAYLNVIASPADDLRLTRIVNVPARGIGERSMKIAREIAIQEGCSIFSVMSRAESFPDLKRAAGKMLPFVQLIESLRNFARENAPDALYDELLDKTGYLRQLESSGDPQDEARAENVKELKSSILEFMKSSGETSLDAYLANVALYTDLDNYDRGSDSVVLMTMHSAKGLEFPTVFLVGMEETVFPGMRAIGEPEELEEERRLCYVAITRAKRKLYLTCARQRMLFGRTTANRVSRFVDEIPEEHIRKNVPKGYGYYDRHSELGFAYRSSAPNARGPAPGVPSRGLDSTVPGSRSSGYPGRQAGPGGAPRPTAPAAQAKPRPEPPSFVPGDKVRHTAFGDGEIVKLTPMGGDALVEIHFEKVGSKKLMLRAAARFMEKC
ncbi:MAG: UvrD-helicase domain-containing protein [Oscillospiraceae bacterium]|nr:UvrD-helicase domain-containing protein [Oscillospiraceae bacterium]